MAYKIEYIRLNEIKVQKHNVRVKNMDQGIEDLAASIKAVGLLQPITAFHDSERDMYVILTGQRRFNAYNHLNEKYPNKGFDKIGCIIIDEPESDETKIALSLAENITQLPMEDGDRKRAVTELFNAYGNYEMIQEKFGITRYMVDKYVTWARLPQPVKDAINKKSINKNRKKAENMALKAMDALDHVSNEETTAENIIKLAKEMADGIPDDIITEISKGVTIKEASERAKKTSKKKVVIHLGTEIVHKLRTVAGFNDETEGDRATHYVVTGVERDYSQIEE